MAAVVLELGNGESLLHNWVTRHRLTEGSGALQPEQAAKIARLKRARLQGGGNRDLRKSDGVLCAEIPVRYAFPQTHEDRFSVLAMCRVSDVTRSGHHAWKRRGERPRDEGDRVGRIPTKGLASFTKVAAGRRA